MEAAAVHLTVVIRSDAWVRSEQDGTQCCTKNKRNKARRQKESEDSKQRTEAQQRIDAINKVFNREEQRILGHADSFLGDDDDGAVCA